MRRVGLTSLVLFLATFAVFSRVLLADFVRWDDNISVYENPHIQGLDWARLRWMFSDASYGMRYKPLTWLAYALVHQVGGLNPLGYHLANLLVHCFNAVLVFVVIRRLLAASIPGQDADERLTQATLPAAGGALLWAINPLRVEAVARVTDLTFCLTLLFLLISLWCYLRAQQSGNPTCARRSFYWCSVGAFALSMLSLPFAFGYAVVLVVLDWHPLRRFEGCTHWWQDGKARQVLLEKIPFLALGGLLFVTFLARMNPTGIWAARPAVASGFNSFERAMQAFYVWAYYVWKPWLPFHLSPVYTTLVKFNPNAWPFWLSAALVIGTTVLLVRRRKQWPWALALWISHLALLVPALGLTERPHYSADRYDYVPGLVWAVVIAAALWRTSLRPRLFAAGAACAAGLALFWGTLSVGQTRVWHDSITLFNHMLGELGNHPYSFDIHWRLGWVLARQGKTDEAIQHYQTSLQIQPSANTYAAFARLMETKGNAEAALTNYLGLLQLDRNVAAFAKAGALLSSLGRTGEAISFYRTTLIAYPNLAPVLENLAWLLATDPDATNRNGAEAVRLAERACALTDRQTPALVGTLAAAYAEAGRFGEAVATAQKACALASKAKDQALLRKNQELLELYRAGQAYHEATRSAPASGNRPAIEPART